MKKIQYRHVTARSRQRVRALVVLQVRPPLRKIRVCIALDSLSVRVDLDPSGQLIDM